MAALRTTGKRAGIAFGSIVAGGLAYGVVPEQHRGELATFFPGILAGTFILQGGWGLFSRAAFPERSRDAPFDSRPQAVVSASFVVVGVAQLVRGVFGIVLLVCAFLAIVLARLRVPGRFFAADSRASP